MQQRGNEADCPEVLFSAFLFPFFFFRLTLNAIFNVGEHHAKPAGVPDRELHQHPFRELPNAPRSERLLDSERAARLMERDMSSMM